MQSDLLRAQWSATRAAEEQAASLKRLADQSAVDASKSHQMLAEVRMCIHTSLQVVVHNGGRTRCLVPGLWLGGIIRVRALLKAVCLMPPPPHGPNQGIVSAQAWPTHVDTAQAAVEQAASLKQLADQSGCQQVTPELAEVAMGIHTQPRACTHITQVLPGMINC